MIDINALRHERIAERRKAIPRAYRKTYDKAVERRSFRAAIKAQCLECVCWARDEVRNCTDLACPLYAYRPYQESSQSGHKCCFTEPESQNQSKEVSQHV